MDNDGQPNSPPKAISASGRGRCRAAGHIQNCASASLSNFGPYGSLSALLPAAYRTTLRE